MSDPKAQYVLSNETGICLLECQTAFAGLTPKERVYSHHLSQASWNGALICLLQTSPESPGLFVLLQKLFRGQSLEELKSVALEKGLTEDQFQAFSIYVAGFYANMGNYKSFGDTKFIPNLPKEQFEVVIKNSQAYRDNPKTIQQLWDRVSQSVYSLSPKVNHLGLGDKGTTTYFSDNCTEKDADVATAFMTKKDISPYNTRFFKTVDPASGKVTYEIRLASVKVDASSGDSDMGVLGSHQFTTSGATEAVTINVTRGDYSPLMDRMVNALNKAKESVANENEEKMLTEYIRSFTDGSIPAHKEGSRHWIKNKGPIVESYIGFIESYRDPVGARGEFEGFVAVVNKDMSAKFTSLVESADHFLPLLPWGSAYEKDVFHRPDFTSLDVLTYGSSGIPAGINIPNYDDVRQENGFKNVSLGNVLNAGYKDTKVTFLEEADKELYFKLKIPSFEVQVGLHELLGHGSGKHFIKNADGTFNFDTKNVHNLETGGQIESWYEHNETWDTKFGAVSSSYEECRAECVGIYLCLSSEILRIFGHTHSDADDIIYINWLNMVRAGLLSLEFYSPETRKWRQV